MHARTSFRIAFVLVLLSTIAAQADDAIEAWHKEMVRRPLPKKGCFEAKHPSTEWREVPCTTPPDRPFPPADADPHNHFAAETSKPISSAIGSFERVHNVTKEHSVHGKKKEENAYSLQLNSSFFHSPACDGKNKECRGWQQFIYSSTDKSLFMQYWLRHHGTPCPKRWKPHPHKNAPASCFRNSDNAVPVKQFKITQLGDLTLGGAALAGGRDTVTMTTPDKTLHAYGEDSVLGLAKEWRYAEFVVVGNGGGSKAVFNEGATIVVRTSVDDGTTKAPECATRTFTAETNNLRLIKPCCTHGGSSPAIVFTLSNAKGAKSHCSD